MAKTLVGTVSSVSADKTIVINVHTRKTHPIYKKQFSVAKKFMAHDEENTCKVGDLVSISETRPISARKRFKLDKIIERARLSKDDLKAMESESDDTKTEEKPKAQSKEKPEAKPKTKPDTEAEE